MHEAMLYEKLPEAVVRCFLCEHRCVIRPGRRGICAVRENQDGTLYTLVYGMVISQAVDPIEKKPLFHFLPGSTSYSIATPGCNFRCRFCQNAQISQLPRLSDFWGQETATPSEIVSAARRHGCRSISYTYTEPTIFLEFAYDVMVRAKAAGLRNVWVTNGYMTPECLDIIAPPDQSDPLLDAANVDLKAWSDTFYRQYAGARLDPVLQSLRLMKQRGVWVEVTTLIIPGLNDNEEELKELAGFIKEDLGADTPWHVSRFHPSFELLDRPPTPVQTLQLARRIGLEAGLHYVYLGNVPGTGGEDTSCFGCGCALLQRRGFQVLADRIAQGACPQCGAQVPGVWE
ncbi:MAG: AmmeMemoRadiSam system radical SAM enzyme [Anaerolineae bacterium]|nr:AmmeMemoRadiSam system radical SAM enzyme [Anaerolineae bacterium]